MTFIVAPVETCPDPCLRCHMFLLIHFASGVRNKKGTAAVLFWFCWGSNGLLGSGFYMPMFLSFVEFSVPVQGQSRGLSRKPGPRRAFNGRRWSRWVMMSDDECILVVECTSYDIFWQDDLLWGCVTSSNQTLPSEANIISCSMIKGSWREKDSFFILLPDTLAQQSQQYCHKAKSGEATIVRSWFKAPKQANAHNSPRSAWGGRPHRRLFQFVHAKQ